MKLIRRFCFWSIVWLFAWMVIAGTEVNITFNKERSVKAQKTLWSRTLKVARGIGDFKQAIWR